MLSGGKEICQATWAASLTALGFVLLTLLPALESRALSQ